MTAVTPGAPGGPPDERHHVGPPHERFHVGTDAPHTTRKQR